jgi:SAM-dependent methyltransferase
MAEPLYDRPEFFAAYSRLPRAAQGLAAAPEWPRLRAMLPALRGLRVVDLGCGAGWFCRWARAQGAARVVGVDVSRRMLARAAAAGADPFGSRRPRPGLRPGGQSHDPTRAWSDQELDELRELSDEHPVAEDGSRPEPEIRWCYELIAPPVAGAVVLVVLLAL